MLKKVIDWGLKISCGAVGAFVLFIVSMAMGTISWLGVYEPEMPDVLILKNSGG